ncbi:MAG: hypothetical protein ACREL1_00470, partial [bacterium]
LIRVGNNSILFSSTAHEGDCEILSYTFCGPFQAYDCYMTITPMPNFTPSETTSPTPPTQTPTPELSPTSTWTPIDSQTATATVSPTSTFTLTPTTSPTGTVGPTSTPTCPGSDFSVNATPYKQYDQRWKTFPLDDATPTTRVVNGRSISDPNTIGGDGCLLTCYSMVSGIDPKTLDATLTGLGDIVDTGKMDPIKSATALGWTLDATIPYSDPSLQKALDKYDFVILEVKANGVGHFILPTGGVLNPSTKDCDYSIQDPGFSRSFLSSYSEGTRIYILGFYFNN